MNMVSVSYTHLGLVTSAEVEHFQEKVTCIASQMKETLDIDGILKIAKNASENEIHYKEKKKRNLRIAVAKDEAFCFLYEDNLDYLRPVSYTHLMEVQN